MNNTVKRRMLRIAPLAIAIALATGACALPGSVGGYSSSGSSKSSGSGSGSSVSASGMSADQVALWCTTFDTIHSPDIDTGSSSEIERYQKLRKATPSELQENVGTLIADYQAIDSKKRIFAQLKEEMMENYGSLKDFNNQVCVAH